MDRLSISLKVTCAEKYPAKQHIQRVARELDASEGLIYLLGQYNSLIEDSDQPRPWKQRRYFYYCSGVDVPNCCLVYRISQDELILYIPEINPKTVMWQGRPPTIEEAKARYDVDDVRHNSDLFGDLKEWIHQDSLAPFYILHPTHMPEMDIPKLDTKSLLPAMDRCRVIKDHYEVSCIRKANQISTDAHRAVLRNVRYLTNEAQIQGIFEYTLTSQHTAKAYDTIAGSGANAGILHYANNNEPLKGRQLVCLDAGAMWKNYASDVTRTFPISGYYTPEAREIYALVDLMQTSAIEALKPGVRMWDLHQRCHRILIEGFLKLGIFRGGSADEIGEAGTSKGFLPHGLGHHVGLDVHDVIRQPILRYLPSGGAVRCDTPLTDPPRTFELRASYKHLFETILEPCGPKHPPLQEGMVVTIEPGIYFNRYELERAYLHTEPHNKYIDREVLDQYWRVGGVRIEDDLLITQNGFENLTTAPKGNEALELIRTGSDCRDWKLG